MKVVQINAVYPRGSTGYIVQAIDTILKQNDIESWIAYAEGPDPWENGIRIGSGIDHKAHALLSHVLGKQGYFSTYATKKLIERLKAIGPDVVHLHNLHHNYINIELLFSYLSENHIKTVFTLHDCWFFTGKCTHFQVAKCNKWITGCHSCPQLLADNPSWFFDNTKKAWEHKAALYRSLHSAHVVGASYWISDLARHSILKSLPISTIHNGIDTKVFAREGDNLRRKLNIENKYIVLTMANKMLNPENRGLLEHLANRLPEDVILLLLGADFTAKKSIGISAVQTSEEMARIYRTADVFLNVSHEDTLPTVNLESMACGTPVVSYSVCGCTETMGENTGVLVRENDWDALVKAILEVRKLGKGFYSKHCIDHIAENYEYQKCFTQYLRIYKGEVV